MNRDEIKKMISLIDDDKLAEAETGTLDKNRTATRPFWQKSALVAAVVVLVITTSLIWTKFGPGFIPTEITTTTPMETTTGATVIAPRWEERAVYEKYTGGATINGIEYQSGVRELDADLIEAELGSLRLSGYDIYEDKTYEIGAAFFRIRDIDPDCVVAVRYEGHDGYYGFFNSGYQFETLADLIIRLNLPEHLQLNNTFIHSVWYGDKQKELLRWDYYSLPDPDIVWDQLFAQTAIVNEGEAVRDKLGWEVMSISIDYAPAGQSNIGIVLFDNGYLTTNILWSLQSFYIGEDAVMAFRDYVLKNGTLEERIGLDSPVETTVPAPAEGEVTTKESAAQTTQGTTKP